MKGRERERGREGGREREGDEGEGGGGIGGRDGENHVLQCVLDAGELGL